MLITISGLPGAGTTTVSRLVAEALDLERVPGGEVFREMALEAGMSLADFGAHAAEHPEIDVELDRRLEGRARKGDCVIESRLAGWVVTLAQLPALRVWIDCDADVSAARVAMREGTAPDVAAAESTARAALEHQRYQVTYGIDLFDRSIYDLVLDSSATSPEDLATTIVGAARASAG